MEAKGRQTNRAGKASEEFSRAAVTRAHPQQRGSSPKQGFAEWRRERESERASPSTSSDPSLHPSFLRLCNPSLSLAPPASPFSGVEPFEWMERKRRGVRGEGDQGRRRNGRTNELRERRRNAASMDKWIGEEKSMMRENRISRLPPNRPNSEARLWGCMRD